MEQIRHKLDQGRYHDLQPLGRTKPARGVVYEDLGRTEFKTSSKTNGTTSKRQGILYDKNEIDDNASSEDDADLLSPKHGSSPLSIPPTGHKTSTAPRKKNQSIDKTRMTPSTSSSRSRVKPRPNFRGAEQPDTKEEYRPRSSTRGSFCASVADMPPSNQLALQRSQKRPSRELGHGTSPLEELSPNRAKGPKKEGKREPEPFPMQDDCDATKSESKSHKRPEKSRRKREPEPFPMQDDCDSKSEFKSQNRKQRRRDPAPFPLAIPSPSHSPRSKEDAACSITQRFPHDSHSTQGAPDGEEDEEDELALTDHDAHVALAYGGPRPFPMPIPQFLQQSTDEVSGSKRSAGDNNEQRVKKRSRSSPDPNAFDDFSSLSLAGEGHVDPSSICPYCDEPWPSAPSPTLLSLLERTKRKSYTDPRPGNAFGLKAPLAAFIELCQRHRFEMTHLPLALERGWPTRLDFASLPKRIRGFKRQLKRFIDHPYESQFWNEIREDVKEVGRLKVVSVSGQYATFERTQPGYYGEQGSIIIHQTLYSLFPPDDMPLTSVDPLTPDQFLTRVLVPESAVLLIQEDMRLSTKAEALRVLDESKKYGLAMFPEQAQGEEAAEVGEQLARERARERRKLLEERGEADADVKRQVEREHRLARKAKGSDKGQSAAKGMGKPAQKDNQDMEWTFNLRDVPSSPDGEDVDFDEMAARYEGSTEPRKWSKKRTKSDVGVMENDSTPKPRENMRRTVQRYNLDDSSDTDPASKKATLQPKQATKQRGDQGVGVALGQTKRKKKGMTKDKSAASDAEGSAHSSSWLLDDISE